MSVAIRTATRIQDQDDFGSTPGAGNDGYALTWDNGAGEFVLTAAGGGGVTDHGALTGLSDDDHSQYLLATGSRAGASASAQTFTNGVVGPSWKPASDSVTALQLQNAAGAYVLNVDTTNKRIGIGSNSPGASLHVATSVDDYAIFTLNNTVGQFGATLTGVYGQIQWTGGNQESYGGLFYARHANSSGNSKTLAGGQFIADSTGASGTSNKHYGGIFISRANAASFTVTNGYAGSFEFGSTNASAVMTNGYGVYILSGRATGTLTTGYGLYIEAQNAAGTNYAIYTNAGKVRLGDIINFAGTMGDSSKAPGTDAPADWVQCEIGGTTYYIPAYAA